MFGIFRNGRNVNRPKWVRLEASTLCQLDCAKCYMRRGNFRGVGAGVLAYGDFVKFVRLNPYVKGVELSNNGEVFLNPELVEIMEFGRENGIVFTMWGGVNFNTVSDAQIEACVRCGILGIVFSIDGASPGVYSKYRRRGNFDAVIGNIRKLNEFKAKYNSVLPYMKWQYIILEGNSDIAEIQRAKKLAAELGCSIAFKKDWDGFVPENRSAIEAETGLDFSPADTIMINGYNYFDTCTGMWNMPAVNWDGRVFGCCVNVDKEFGGNAFEEPLEKLLGSKLMRATRKMLTGGGEKDRRAPIRHVSPAIFTKGCSRMGACCPMTT